MQRNVWSGICELANKTTQLLYKVSTPCLDDHQFKEGEMGSVGKLSKSMLSNCPEVCIVGTHWFSGHSMVGEQTCTSSHKMDQSLRQTLGSFDFLFSTHEWI